MKIRVLIVDPAAFVRDALKRSLRHFMRDVEIFDANSGNRALPVLRTNKIDLIIAEWAMEDMSGRELLVWARAEEKYAKTPFIVTSDEGDRNLVMNAIAAGANDFMAKPFSPDEVQKKMMKQLTRIGYKSTDMKAEAQNAGLGSLDVLTGGGAPKKPQVMKPREIKSAGFGKPAPKKAPAAKSSSFEGVAHVHLPQGSVKCAIRELSLTGISGMIQRPSPEAMPRVFDTATADLQNAQGEAIGTLNVYVHALQAGEPRANASTVKLSLRFGENDPAQFEQLSKLVARGR